MPSKRALALAVTLQVGLWAGGAATTPAAADCIAGTCTTGIGTMRTPDGADMTGQWFNGRPAPGATLQVRSPCLPTPVELTYGPDQRPLSGTMVRGCYQDPSAMSKAATPYYFTGTFQTITNPFTGDIVTSYKNGRYVDGRGLIWEGAFDYIPYRKSVDVPSSGTYYLMAGTFVFSGARIDTALDEVTQGLFVSEPVEPGVDIRFIRARPDYLAKLRTDYMTQQAQHTAARQAEAEESAAASAFFGALLSVATNAAVMYGAGDLPGFNSEAAGMLSGMLRGDAVPDILPGGQALSALAGLPMASPKAMTVADYQNVLQGAILGAMTSPSASSPQAVPPLPTAPTAYPKTAPQAATVPTATSGKAGAQKPAPTAQIVPLPNTSGKPVPPAQTQPTKAAASNESWKTCGPNALCEAGDGLMHFCAGPARPGAPRCISECTMSSGVIYHDTSLPANAAYVPLGQPCAPGCTVVNSCD